MTNAMTNGMAYQANTFCGALALQAAFESAGVPSAPPASKEQRGGLKCFLVYAARQVDGFESSDRVYEQRHNW